MADDEEEKTSAFSEMSAAQKKLFELRMKVNAGRKANKKVSFFCFLFVVCAAVRLLSGRKKRKLKTALGSGC